MRYIDTDDVMKIRFVMSLLVCRATNAPHLLVAHVAADEELVRCLADDGRPLLLLKRGGILAVSERFDVCALLVEVAYLVTIGHVVRRDHAVEDGIGDAGPPSYVRRQGSASLGGSCNGVLHRHRRGIRA